MLVPKIWITFLLLLSFYSPRFALAIEPDEDEELAADDDRPITTPESTDNSKRSSPKGKQPVGIDLQDDSPSSGPATPIQTIKAPLTTPSREDIPPPPTPTLDLGYDDSGIDPQPSSLVEIPTPLPDAYRIGIGDLLAINVWSGDYFEEDFKGNYVVLDSGTVDLPLVGRVDVFDLSEEGAAAAISNALRHYIVTPIVQLQVSAFNSQRISVLGAVQRPGVIQISGKTTLLEALAERQLTRKKRANGAWAAQKVHLHRQGGEIVVIDLESLLSNAKGNVVLSDGDMIYVSDGAYVYINGKVKQPGPVPFRAGMTVTDAIAEAGGSARGSNLTKVFIMRGTDRKEVNVKKIFQGKHQDVILKEGDRLFIEESIW